MSSTSRKNQAIYDALLVTDSHILFYPIKCDGCQDLVAMRVNEYLELHKIQGYSRKETLDMMGLHRECTRTHFLTPAKLDRQLENRKLIEGQIPLTADLKPDREPIREAVSSMGTVLKLNSARIEDVEIESYEPTSYDYPTELGMPTINRSDFPDTKKMRYLGAGRYSEVLAGRKYICL